MRFSKVLITGIFAAVTAGMIGCSGSSPTVVDMGGEKISLSEFEAVYAKNNGGLEAAKKTSQEDREKFLDLYTKFKLKVKEARALGYDKDQELIRELADYRKNLAVSYLLEKEITGPALQRMYDRKLKEIRASHILLRIADPKDTLATYQLAQKLIDSLKAGTKFEALALRHSQDPSVQHNLGDLYYFTTGMMVPEFEDAVFSLNVGEVSPFLVRTQFGYHILKVTDIQKNQGPVHVAHIMKRLSPGSTADDTIKAKAQLKEILDSLRKGGDFAEFAKNHSDDTFSGQRGGDLGFIERGRTVHEFDAVIFKLKDGEISDMIQTQFGFHIAKRFTSKGIASLKDMEQDLKSEYQRYRFQFDYDRMVEKVKKLYSFKQDSAVVALFASSVDTTKLTGDAKWDSTVTKTVRGKILFSFAGQTVSVDSVINLANLNPELRNMALNLPTTIPTIVTKIGTSTVMEYYAHSMENNFPDFSSTMKEYQEGILLFKAEQENVWNKVAPTDSALKKFHAANHAKYTWNDRINVQEIFVETDSIAKLVQKSLRGYTVDSLVARKTKSKNKKQLFDTLKIAVAPISFDSAAAKFNKRSATIDKRGVWGLQTIATNEATQRGWTRTVNDTLTYVPVQDGFQFVKTLQRDPAREKTFEEAASEVSSAFQEFETKRLSDEWYEILKKKYHPIINNEVVKQAFSQKTK